MQLELDFSSLPAVGEPTAPHSVPDPPLPDTDLGRFARARMAYGSPRERQGVVHRFALTEPELVEVSAKLCSNANAGDPAAAVEVIALLSGIPPGCAGGIGLCDTYPPGAPVIAIDLRSGQMHTDMGRICLAQAAPTPSNGTALPASHMLVKPLPRFLVELLRQAACASPRARSLGELLPCTPTSAAVPIAGNKEGRLRATHARARDGLSALAITLGLDNYDAALVTNDFALIDRSRLFYVRSDPRRVMEGCRSVYAALGWHEPVPGEVVLPFGSNVVPQDECVVAVFNELRRRVEAFAPGRRYTLDALLVHHNHYALLVAWLLGFCVGAREATMFDFNARTCRPSALFVPYRDKSTGPFKQVRPVLMCRVARELVGAWWRHLHALHARAQRLGAPATTAWMRHLGAVFAGDRVPLLFTAHDETVVPIGSAHVADAVPADIRLVANAGRHYWQTVLYRQGIASHAIDVYARHACRGTEPMSSTTLASPLMVHEQVCSVQDAVLRELGITSVSGLGRRVSP
ncbi:hypothetical protein [Piscinibacter sp.]|jgi:hypothetical protein|uniref:hypothetical protein n=1 Tax=Piscinibacter sp. TaxID=1903157 RepID=UPI00355A9015